MTAIIYLHPTLTGDPDLVSAVQERTGLSAQIHGRAVLLVGTPAWRGRPAPARGVESRTGSLFTLPCAPVNAGPSGGDWCA